MKRRWFELSEKDLLGGDTVLLAQFAVARGWEVCQDRVIQHGRQMKISDGQNHATVAIYSTGKVLVQGRRSNLTDELAAWCSSHLQGDVSRAGGRQGAAGPPDPARASGIPRIGIDESGKGDYFGPMVAAGVYVDRESESALIEIGVVDSKRLPDARISKLAASIRNRCPHSVVPIGPARYNQLYVSMRNVNVMLAWAHARCLENLLTQVECGLAVSDQFGDESYLTRALMEKGRQVKLEQHPRAEVDVAVAAASILARDEFVRRLAALSHQAGIELPKGASDPRIVAVGCEIASKGGREVLANYAKLHFRTTQSLGI
ncbi:MAG TPA: ribonuclease HIII [Bacillota bacterium]|nr:ribonuclease HIII [Bacillota bacterium]